MNLNQYKWNPDNDLIAEGAFAEVFKAKDTNTNNRYVALKIYKEAVSKGSSVSTGLKKYSLEKEFQNVDGLSHSNIITYFGLDYLKHEDVMGRSISHAVLIMEYATEGTLANFMQTHPENNLLDKIIKDILNGVSYLHTEGIIHRDLKPGNILITKNRKGFPIAKITDFGISRDVFSDNLLQHSMTEGVGTPHYMAPEQIYKKRFGIDGEITNRTDIWAIGVIIYRMLTGKLPFGNNSKDYELVKDAIVNDTPDYSKVPSSYVDMLKACFQKEAAKRPKKVDDLLLLIKELDEKTKIVKPQKKEIIDETIILNQQQNSVKSFKKNPSENKNQLRKWEKIILWVFGIINLLASLGTFIVGFGNYEFFIISLYPICITLLFFLILKSKENAIAKVICYGILLYGNILLTLGIIESFPEKSSDWFIWYFFKILFWSVEIIFPFWLLLRKRNLKTIFLNKPLNVYFLLFALILFCFSFLLTIYNDYNGFDTIHLIKFSDGRFLTLIPNVFFTMAIFLFLFKKHKDFLKFVIILFICSIFIASSWWMFLSSGNGYSSWLHNALDISGTLHINKLKSGYYVWLLSIILGFSIITYDALKNAALKKYYISGFLFIFLVLGGRFSYNFSKSKNGYNIEQAIENIDYALLDKTMDAIGTFDFNSYPNIMSDILSKYSDENASNQEKIATKLIDAGWEGKDEDGYLSLKEAIDTKDLNILERILNTEAVNFINDTVKGGNSMLYYAKNLNNEKIKNLLVNKGAKHIIKDFEYYDDFSDETSTSRFKESSSDNRTWKYIFESLQLKVINDNYSYWKGDDFEIDTYKYTVETDIIISESQTHTGLYFDYDGTNGHVFNIANNYVELHLFKDKKWKELKRINVSPKKTNNTLKVVKEGNYISCYLNNQLVIYNFRISPIEGSWAGVVVTYSEKPNTIVSFDNFRVTGTQTR
ncbi:protein kinase [Flavivirga amylovorans]|uniref:Protein kinase n=1 Tax=Flavivirga amylovorans TaxID=870486 RepID=A0ABT8WX49_9FLAO|nr:serine/threonine-protein kinase [Flavivirga amylovorans]MDO5986251.1 protein kinase [Flavivirga amylovorans]